MEYKIQNGKVVRVETKEYGLEEVATRQEKLLAQKSQLLASINKAQQALTLLNNEIASLQKETVKVDIPEGLSDEVKKKLVLLKLKKPSDFPGDDWLNNYV